MRIDSHLQTKNTEKFGYICGIPKILQLVGNSLKLLYKNQPSYRSYKDNFII